ncbi:DUF4013 domain-containing protein [Salinirubrum litoreum]|uniref:DUF4013 domain-containing protein n=1 Tax=Salinirubrum litoreum TaxID=1126234 RepID=A0ABD5RAP8_9EURY|nr:DUF4013 domain-containing protein [Salinirubrum litoreum]
MLREALGYPLRGDHAVETLLVGGLCHLLAAFVPVVPLLPVVGYLVCALDDRARSSRPDLSETTPPTFHDFRGILRRGLGGSLIVVAYLAVPTVVLVVTLGGTLSQSLGSVPGVGLSLGFYTASTVTLLVAVLFAYLLPAGLSAYAVGESLRSAFDPSAVRSVATDARYFVTWGVAVVVLSLAGVLFAPLNAVGAGFFLAFYAEVVAVGLWGRGVVRLGGDDSSPHER